MKELLRDGHRRSIGVPGVRYDFTVGGRFQRRSDRAAISMLTPDFTVRESPKAMNNIA